MNNLINFPLGINNLKLNLNYMIVVYYILC